MPKTSLSALALKITLLRMRKNQKGLFSRISGALPNASILIGPNRRTGQQSEPNKCGVFGSITSSNGCSFRGVCTAGRSLQLKGQK